MKLSDVNSLFLEITSHCNIKCPQCSRTSHDGELASFVKLQHWDLDVIVPKLQLDQLTNLKFIKLEGDNGDALMHPEIDRLLDMLIAIPSQPNIKILTNGSLRSTTWWRNLGEKYQGRLIVQFSIDGLEDTHSLYRIGADYNKTIENAKAFISSGGEATQRCLIFDHNRHQMEQIAQSARDIGFTQLIIQPGDLFRFEGQEYWQVWHNGKKVHVIKPASIASSETEKYNYNNTVTKLNLLPPKKKEIWCPVLSSGTITITYQGHVIPCCVYHADLYFEHEMNNAFRELVGDPNLISVQERTLNEIFSDSNFYLPRLEEMLRSNSRLSRCQTACGGFLDSVKRPSNFNN